MPLNRGSLPDTLSRVLRVGDRFLIGAGKERLGAPDLSLMIASEVSDVMMPHVLSEGLKAGEYLPCKAQHNTPDRKPAGRTS